MTGASMVTLRARISSENRERGWILGTNFEPTSSADFAPGPVVLAICYGQMPRLYSARFGTKNGRTHTVAYRSKTDVTSLQSWHNVKLQ